MYEQEKKMLNRKQNITDNSEWLAAYEHSTELYDIKAIKHLEETTIAHIRHMTALYKNICSSWISGKDSVVLQNVLEKSGIAFTPIMWRGINEYPALKNWINEHKPHGLIEEIIDKYSLEFLEKHPQYLFCKGNTRTKWMSTKWERQRTDIKKHDFDLFITGRRIKDGNQCGTKANGYISSKVGYDVYSPLAEWNAEQLLAYIRYNNIELSPFYSWDRGFLIGSIAMGEWTERAAMNKTENEVWDEIYEIDPSIVIKASMTLTSAKKYLLERCKK